MYLSVNKKNEVKKVGVDENLTVLYVDENREDYPFNGWSEAKICCCKVIVKDGIIMMVTPYIDSRLLDHFDQVGKATEENATAIEENSDAILETYEANVDTTESVSELENAVLEVYEMLVGESEETE